MKKLIIKDDLEVYNSILKIINEEKEAKIKTQVDLETLQNSQKIKSLDLKIYEIDKHLGNIQLVKTQLLKNINELKCYGSNHA